MEPDKEIEANPADPGLAYIELYKLYVQSADNTSSRRVSVNRYQTGLNVGIVALYGLTDTFAIQTVVQVVIATAGIAISLNWLFTIRSLTRLNAEKFRIIQSMEKCLPRAIYTEEWQGLGREANWRYRGAGFFENHLPLIFALLHIGAITYTTVVRALW